MKKIMQFIIRFFCGFWGIIFLFASLSGLINCFSDQSNIILYIVFTLIFFILGVTLLHKCIPKNKKTTLPASARFAHKSQTDDYLNKSNSHDIEPEPQIAHDIVDVGNVYSISNNSLQTILFRKIPDCVLELLWIYGKNSNDLSEPSLINTSLPISSEKTDPNASIGYYPSYAKLTPEQRYCYLEWLQDITQPIDIGYVFIFYYGLERHLFYGKFIESYEMIKRLRKNHKNGSFQTYSSDALILSAAYHKRYDLMANIDFSSFAPEIAMFLKSEMNIPISSDDLIKIRKHIGFTNDRYIKEDYAKFKDITDEILVQKYGCPNFPLSYEGFKTNEYYPIVLANYSLENRIAVIPDISKISDFSSVIQDILQSAHNKYKLSKHHKINSKPDSNSYSKGNDKVSINHNIVPQKYSVNIPKYMDMKIVSSTLPPNKNYNVLNDMEKEFFRCFSEQLVLENLSPSCIKLTRMSNGGFNVDYIGLCYVGKINLYKPPTKYAVIKPGNKRATKVFDSLEDANEFVNSHAEYEIQTRNTEPSLYMQYLKGLSTIKELNNTSLNECIDHIPDWIRYIKYCMRN